MKSLIVIPRRHKQWRRARHIENPDANYPGIRYILLHTFAHALIRQLTLECGYAGASIRAAAVRGRRQDGTGSS